MKLGPLVFYVTPTEKDRKKCQQANVRVLICVKRNDHYDTEIRIHTRRVLEYVMQYWLSESHGELLDQIQNVYSLQDGESITLIGQIEPWSYHGHSYYGDDYDAGWNLISHRVIKRSVKRK